MWSKGRGAVVLSALAIGAFQVVGSFGAAEEQADRKDIDTLAVVLLLLGPAALALRDRYPRAALAATIAAACVYIGSGYPFGPVFVSVAVAFFSVVLAGQRRAAWALAGVGYAGFFVALELDDHRPEDVGLLHWAVVAGWLVVVLTVPELLRARRQQLVEQRRAAEEERQRRAGEQRLGLAQELHDVLAHNISLINVQASVALHLLHEQPDQARPALTAIKDASHEALQELRTALDVLRHGDGTAPLGPAPTLAELPALVDGWRAGGLEVRLEEAGGRPLLPAAVELAAYRVVQEALTNVTRHAAARSVTVRVGYDDGVRIEVLDDGVGGPAIPGNGIRGMQERAAALGGQVEAGPRPGGGFRVSAHLPVGAA
jgi:signal transduction histidine kinase